MSVFVASLDWPAFLFGIRRYDDGRKNKSTDKIIAQVKKAYEAGTLPQWDEFHKRKFLSSYSQSIDDSYYEACLAEVLDFCLNRTTFADDILGTDEANRGREIFQRNQFSSRLLMSLFSAFLFLLDSCGPFGNGQEDLYKKVSEHLDALISDKAIAIRGKKVEKEFGFVRKTLEEIAPGINPQCIMDGFIPRRGYDLPYYVSMSEELNSHILKKFGYDFNGKGHNGTASLVFVDMPGYEYNNIALRNALIPRPDYWDEMDGKGYKFVMLRFLCSVQKISSLKQATEVVDHIFSVFTSNSVHKELIENSVPLKYLDEGAFVEKFRERDMKFSFDRFKGKYDLGRVSLEDAFFPLGCVEDTDGKIAKGREIFDAVMMEIYPDDCDKVMNFVSDEIRNTVITKENEGDWLMPTVFDSNIFGYYARICDRFVAKVYCPEFFSETGLWSRLYIKAYQVSELVGEGGNVTGTFFEIMYDLFEYVEDKISEESKYKRDTQGRDTAYVELKKRLKTYGVEISDMYKKDYIISLLDRKVAIRAESERFPVIEELGDAVYALAVAEMLFYNPYESEVASGYDEKTNAKFQTEVMKKLSLDELYISASQVSKKYERDAHTSNANEEFSRQEEFKSYDNPDKYLADSLEMILGTVCEDLGYMKAIDLAKAMLRTAFPDEFGEEFHCEDDFLDSRERDMASKNVTLSVYRGLEDCMEEPDEDFWSEIRPAPTAIFNLNKNQSTLWKAFDKIFLCLSLGTEDKDKRDHITRNYSLDMLYMREGDVSGINWVFDNYLRNGLEDTVNRYSDRIKTNYSKTKH